MLVVSGAALPAAAQDSGLRVNVGIAAAKPGDPIDIPLTLSGGESGQIGSVVVHVGVPKKLLTYTEVERGLAVELADGEVTVATADDKSDSSQMVVDFSAKGKSCIKPGILGYLKFNVSTEAQKGDIALKLLGTEATACEGGPLQMAKGDDGQLTVFALDEEIPVIGCFFFSH
ncbi:MAG TPA: cohesin domain-containing protein [Terriglobia bacterium]|nr:cohesin domain-containing protein [Terriglobia bacterium]